MLKYQLIYLQGYPQGFNMELGENPKRARRRDEKSGEQICRNRSVKGHWRYPRRPFLMLRVGILAPKKTGASMSGCCFAVYLEEWGHEPKKRKEFKHEKNKSYAFVFAYACVRCRCGDDVYACILRK